MNKYLKSLKMGAYSRTCAGTGEMSTYIGGEPVAWKGIEDAPSKFWYRAGKMRKPFDSFRDLINSLPFHDSR